MDLVNNLNIDIEAFFLDNNDRNGRRPAGKRGIAGERISHVGSESELPLDTSGLDEDRKLELEIKPIPSRRGVKGIKITPGTDLGFGHDIEYRQKGNSLTVTINYTDNHSTDSHSKDKGDFDPKIEHPDSLV